MPLIKIELSERYDRASLIRIKNTVMGAVLKSLKLPNDDRNIRLIEYPNDLFEIAPPYKILIDICMFSGRTDATKKLLYQTIVQDLYDAKLVDKDQVFIVINEQPLVNWGIRGGIPANEINLDFDINI